MAGILRGIDLRDDEGRGIVNTLYRTATSTEMTMLTTKATSTENSVSMTMAKESGTSDGVVGESEREYARTSPGVQPVMLHTVCPSKDVLLCSPINDDTDTATITEMQGAVGGKGVSKVWGVVKEQVLLNVCI